MRSEMESRTSREPRSPGTFVSGGGGAGIPPRRPVWWLPVLTTLIFGLVFAALMFTSDSRTDLEPQATEAPRASSGPQTSPCITCPLGHTCDGETGQCVLIERSQVECVKGASFDEEAGYCVSDEPAPTARTTPRVTARTAATPAAEATPPPAPTPAATPGATSAPATAAPTPAQ